MRKFVRVLSEINNSVMQRHYSQYNYPKTNVAELPRRDA
jgi:hypothetical protein